MTDWFSVLPVKDKAIIIIGFIVVALKILDSIIAWIKVWKKK